MNSGLEAGWENMAEDGKSGVDAPLTTCGAGVRAPAKAGLGIGGDM